MKLNKVHVAVVAALTGASGLLAQSAFAQQGGGLEEIVVTATRRSENLQEVPVSIVAITGEDWTGKRASEVDARYGLVAPAGVPRDILNKLSAAVAKAAQSPDLKERYAALGLEAVSSTPDQYADYVRRDIAKWRKVVAAAKIKPQ